MDDVLTASNVLHTTPSVIYVYPDGTLAHFTPSPGATPHVHPTLVLPYSIPLGFTSPFPPPPPPGGHVATPYLHSPIRPPKLQLPPFEGQDALDWIFQANKFFSYYQIPPHQHLSMIAFYIKIETLCWFKWMHHNNQLVDWDIFMRALEIYFWTITVHQVELFKLYQYGIVTKYQHHFKQLCNRVYGLNAKFFLNCFILRLNTEIRKELVIHCLTLVHQAIELA